MIDFSLPTFVKATAATRLVVRHPFPDLLYSTDQGPGFSDQASLLVPGTTPVSAAGIGLFDFQDIGLRKHGELHRDEGHPIRRPARMASAGGIYRRRPPTAHEPRWFAEDSRAPRIRTVHGDTVAVRDLITGDCGFMRITETTVEVIQSYLTRRSAEPLIRGRRWWRWTAV